MPENESPRSTSAGLAVLCLSLFIVSISTTIVNLALPSIQRALGATNSQLQWIAVAYTITFACLLLSSGSAADRNGRRRGLVTGLLLFGACSLAAAFARSPWELVAAMAGMGAGGALIMPATLSTVTVMFPEDSARKRALAIWASAGSTGLALGPLLGGALLDRFTWGSVFLVNVPIAFLAAFGCLRLIPDSRSPNPRPRDLPGAALSVIAIVGLLLAIIEAPLAPGRFANPWILASAGLSLTAVAVFLFRESHATHGMLDLGVFRSRRFSVANAALLLGTFVLLGTLFLSPQYLQYVQARTAMETGLAILPMALGMVLLAPVSSVLDDRIGTKLTVALGLIVVAAGLALAAAWQQDTTHLQVGATLALLGIGQGILVTPSSNAVMGSLDPADAGMGSAVNDTTIQIGGALGIGIMGALFASRYHERLGANFLALPAEDKAQLTSEIITKLRTSVADGVEASHWVKEFESEWIETAAKKAFLDGCQLGMEVACGMTLAVLVLVLLALPSRPAAR